MALTGAVVVVTSAGAQDIVPADTSPASAIPPSAVPVDDRVRLAEAFALADAVQDSVWPGWHEAPFAVLLVTSEWEFLMRHSRPSDDFTLLGYDSLLHGDVYVRPSVFPPHFLASFPAVGGVPTIVVGTPDQTGRPSTRWVLTVLHEHFHQFQMSRLGYYAGVDSLDLSGGDQSGMWMLNYPFPYDSADVQEGFAAVQRTLLRALAARDPLELAARVEAYRSARERFRALLDERDYRYFAFQLWQEGVSRHTEYAVARAAAARDPHPQFRLLPDFVPYALAVDSAYNQVIEELASTSLSADRRVAFYAVGAGTAMLLERTDPEWRERYWREMFRLDP